MNDQEFALALTTYPCPNPECGEVGHLHPQKMRYVLTYLGQHIEAEGDGTACDACDMKFPDTALTENLANQVNRINSGQNREYLELNAENGQFVSHPLS